MSRNGIATLALLAGMLVLSCGETRADKTASQRSTGAKSSGSRNDATVPYLTNGGSAFMHGAVAPRIYQSPVVDDPTNPQAKPVFNLIFYGAKQAFGDKSNGAAPKSR